MKRYIMIYTALLAMLSMGVPAEARTDAPKLCTWTVKGVIKTDHQLDDLDNTYGNVSPLKGVKIKVSAQMKTLVGWGTWGEWGQVYTNQDGYFEVDEERSCDNRRRFKVELKFQSDRLEVRHEKATSSTTKVHWYTIHEDGDVERSNHLFDLGDRTFEAGGDFDLDHWEARDHADIWKTYTALIDKLENYGPAYEYKNQLAVKANHNSAVINDNVERSYAQPLNGVIYIFRSNDGTADDLRDMQTSVLLHEAMHVWAYQHSTGEEDLIANAFASGDTHCLESTNVAFHEGFAEFASERLRDILFDVEAPLPFNRDALNNGLSCNGAVDRITSLDKAEEHEYGWMSGLRLLMTKELMGKNFAGTPTTTDRTHPSTQIGQIGGRMTGCPAPPAGVNFKKVLSVFLEKSGTGYTYELKKSQMNFDDFFARAATILDIDDDGEAMILDLLDPAQTVQPNDFCFPVLGGSYDTPAYSTGVQQYLQRNQGGNANTPASSTETSASPPDDRAKSTMKRYRIDQAAHPDAVCNDGSTPVFYHRPGIEDGAEKWVVWFKGGGSCWNRETCGNRASNLMSSRPWMGPATAELSPKGNAGAQDGKAGGILDPDPSVNPDFHSWNHVYLVYCSSDGWAGDNTETVRGRTIHFRGHRIVDAMFDALEDEAIMGQNTLGDASHVLLTGSSAGAQGLRYNLDRLAERLNHADVRGVSDATLVPSVEPHIQEAEVEKHRLSYERWKPMLDASCIAEAGDEPWQCLSSVHLVSNGYLSTPIFVHQDQRDPSHPGNAPEETGAAIRDLLAPLPGVFSPDDGFHIIINDPRFNNQKIDGYTMADILGNWYFGRPRPKSVIEGLTSEQDRTP